MFQDRNTNMPLCECTELHAEVSSYFEGGLSLGDMGVRFCLMINVLIPKQVSWNVEVLPVSYSNGKFRILCQTDEYSVRIMNGNRGISSKSLNQNCVLFFSFCAGHFPHH
jgi:hypothetical protein